MIKLKETKSGFDTSTFSFKIMNENGLKVVFVDSVRTDANRWNKPQVLTDVFVYIFELPCAYCVVDTDGTKIEEYIVNSFKKNKDTDLVIREIEELSSGITEIRISMPTNFLFNERGCPTSARMVSDTFRPVIVEINGIDVSHTMDWFDRFEENAVKQAYEFLVNGKKIDVKNDLIDTEIITEMHNNIF